MSVQECFLRGTVASQPMSPFHPAESAQMVVGIIGQSYGKTAPFYRSVVSILKSTFQTCTEVLKFCPVVTKQTHKWLKNSVDVSQLSQNLPPSLLNMGTSKWHQIKSHANRGTHQPMALGEQVPSKELKLPLLCLNAAILIPPAIGLVPVGTGGVCHLKPAANLL